VILQYVIVMVVTLVAIVVQTTILRFSADLMQVDLLFVIVVILGIFKDPVHGAVQSSLIGYFQDLFYPAAVTGMFMTARMSVFIVGQALRGRLSPDTPLSQFIIALGLGLFDRIVIFLLQGVFSEPARLSFKTVALLAMGTTINAALVPVIFFLLRFIPGFMEAPRGPQILE